LSESKNVKKYLLAVNPFGLCDRITAILLACKVGAQVGRHVHFQWAVNSHCGAAFQYLFRPKVSYLEVSENKKHVVSHTIGESTYSGALAKVVELNEQHGNLKLDSTYRGHNFDDFDDILLPSEEVAKVVSEFMEQYWSNNVIGVHIRRTDKLASGLPGIHRYAQEIGRVLDVMGDARFFVASDEIAPMKELARKFGKRIMTYPVRSLKRTTLFGILDAIVVLFLLRNTYGVIGSSCSGFSLCGAWNRPFTNLEARHTFNRQPDRAPWVFQSILDSLKTKSPLADSQHACIQNAT
jgi:hypothetical protein